MLDTHCHLNDSQYNGEVDQIVNHFLQAGIKKAICIGCDPTTNKKAKEIAYFGSAAVDAHSLPNRKSIRPISRMAGMPEITR